MPIPGGDCDSGVNDGVLLYYKYVPIADVHSIVEWYKDLCTSLQLVGRIRVSPEGVNVTIGGSTSALEEHIAQVSSHPNLGSCDFKVARCSEPLLANPLLVQECGFDSLSVRAVKEVVSLGDGAFHATPAVAGTHLSPADFHQHLLAAAAEQADSGNRLDGRKSGVVILDARNVYETRIGKFKQLPGVEFYNPRIRQFSDLPAWLDANEDCLRDKHVYMYCTGGVRCERASAYLRVKGPAFQNVYQLSGGIQRYLEAFPEGGLFAGKNFVFDPRVAVSSADDRKVGRCLLCRSPFDDYAPRCRCARCRLLVLVCDNCRENTAPALYACELCRDAEMDGRVTTGKENGGGVSNSRRKETEVCGLGSTAGNDSAENGASARGTGTETDDSDAGTVCAGGQKEWGAAGQEGRVNEPRVENGVDTSADGASRRGTWGEVLPRRRLRVLCLHGFRQTGRGLKGRLAAFQRHLGELLELVFVDGPFQLPCVYYPEALGGGVVGDQAGRGDGEEAAERCAHGAGGAEQKGSGKGTGERTRGKDCAERGAERGVRERGLSPRREGVSGEGECFGGKASGWVNPGADVATFDSKVCISGGKQLGEQAPKGPFPKYAWLVSPKQLREIEALGDDSGQDSGTAGREKVAGDVHGKGPTETATVELRVEDCAAETGDGSGGRDEAGRRAVGGADWRPASVRFGPLQYLTQTAGLEASLAHLRRIVAEQGPFDGVLGFSQGAAVAAALCREAASADGLGDESAFRFRFAILCSGFLSPAEGLEDVSRQPIDLPSLHVFGSSKGSDRQMEAAESERLAEQFERRRRVVVRHPAGHIVPISKSHVNQYRSFFLKTL